MMRQRSLALSLPTMRFCPRLQQRFCSECLKGTVQFVSPGELGEMFNPGGVRAQGQ